MTASTTVEAEGITNNPTRESPQSRFNHSTVSGDGGDEGIFVSSAGLVGIGTTTPTAILTLSSNSTGVSLIESDGSAGFNTSYFVQDSDVFSFQTRTGGNAFVSNDYIIAKDASGASSHVWRIGNQEKLRIASTGNVGIGTTTPATPLHVLSATTTQFRLGYSNTNYANFSISSGGDLTIAPTGSDTNITGNATVSATTTTASLSLSGALKDSVGSVGSNGNVLMSTATSSRWVATSTLGISGGGGTKEIFILPSTNQASTYPINQTISGSNVPVAVLSDVQGVRFGFHLPEEMTTLLAMEVIIYPDTTETIQADIGSSCAGVGQIITDGCNTNANDQTLAVTAERIAEWDVYPMGIWSNLNAGDYVGIRFDSDTSSIPVMGLRVTYQ